MLGADQAFTIVELGPDGVVTWEVRRDHYGVPQAQHWPPVQVSLLLADDASFDERLRRIIGGSRVLFAEDPADEDHAELFYRLGSAYPNAPVISRSVPLEAVLRDVIAGDPVTEWYELVVLRRIPSGRLVLQGRPLIPAEAERGYSEKFKIRCEPSDPHGTVFAVVARRQERDFRLVSVKSVTIEPGVYNLTARLIRPNRVSFDELPGLHEEPRSWSDLVAAVPDTLDRGVSAHLICAVEVCGTAKRFEQRIRLVKWLIEHIENADTGLSVSLISYGQHSFDSRPEEPVTVLTWAESSNPALSALERLLERGPATSGYPRAAQLECVLTEVVRRLADHAPAPARRPVLVAVGSRPAFPPRVDPATGILPCPARHDWSSALRHLRHEHPGITFGAICDQGPASGVWAELRSGAFASGDVVDVRPFAAALDLSSEAQPVPFPLLETEGV